MADSPTIGSGETRAALISGGSRGIGRAIAEDLAGMGVDVSVVGRDSGALAESVAAIESEGRRGHAIVSDLGHPDGVREAFDRHMAAFGRVDIMVNNAASRSSGKPILDVDLENFEQMLRLNLSSYFQFCQLAGREMKGRNWGRIINIASSTALKARKDMGDYSISKASELMLTRQFAVELAPYGVTVNAIAPTLTRTEFSRWQWEDEAERDKVLSTLPVGRLAEATDTSRLAAFLASDDAAMITGVIIPVDGGGQA